MKNLLKIWNNLNWENILNLVVVVLRYLRYNIKYLFILFISLVLFYYIFKYFYYIYNYNNQIYFYLVEANDTNNFDIDVDENENEKNRSTFDRIGEYVAMFIIISIFSFFCFFGFAFLIYYFFGGNGGNNGNNLSSGTSSNTSQSTILSDLNVIREFDEGGDVGFFDRFWFNESGQWIDMSSHPHDAICVSPDFGGSECSLIMYFLYFLFFFKTNLIHGLFFYFPEAFYMYMGYKEIIEVICMGNENCGLLLDYDSNNSIIRELNLILFVYLKEIFPELYPSIFAEFNRDTLFRDFEIQIKMILSTFYSELEIIQSKWLSDHYILIDDKHLQYSKVYQPFNNFNEIRELIQILEDATLCTKITGQEFIDLFESNRYVISTDQTTTYELYELFRDFENYCSSTQYIFDMEDLEHFAKFFERFENKIYLDFFVKMLRICGNDVELLNKFLYVFTKILGPDVGYFSNKGILDSYTFINDNIKILQKLKDILNLRYGENFNIVFSNIVTILNMELENGSTEFTRTFLDYFIYSYAKGDLNYFIEILSNIYPEDYIDFIEEINQNIEKMRNK